MSISIIWSMLTSTITTLHKGKRKAKVTCCMIYYGPKFPLELSVDDLIPTLWRTFGVWSCPGDISSVHRSFTDLPRPVIICHKASQSILISHLLLITIPCKRNSGLGLEQLHLTQGRGEKKQERGKGETQRERGEIIRHHRSNKKTSLCKNSMILGGKCHHVPLMKSDHFQALVPAMELWSYITPQWQIHHSYLIVHPSFSDSTKSHFMNTILVTHKHMFFCHLHWYWVIAHLHQQVTNQGLILKQDISTQISFKVTWII